MSGSSRTNLPTWAQRRRDRDPDALKRSRPSAFSRGTGNRIGVSVRDFNDDEVKAGKATAGIVIEDVEADSPAQKAGFKAGDIVVEFDGERVRSTRQFIAARAGNAFGAFGRGGCDA